ncbi:coiled-coil domain-containing protein [Mycoplasmopsis meleagridis]|uniref:coiled-coil domain-containing protein n=1 Tax=Mycoplasmopsis meleagridis TaxID=29561 RepID=UPI003A860F78
MKKKYLFSLPIVSSLATLPFFISQADSTTNNNSSTSSNQSQNTSNNSALNQLINNTANSTVNFYKLSLQTLNNITLLLADIQNNYQIDTEKIGKEYLGGLFVKVSELTRTFNTLVQSKQINSMYPELLKNNSEFMSIYSDLTTEYYAAKHLNELLKNGDKDLRSYLASQASNIYENTKKQFNLSNHNANNNLFPPVKLIANAYDETAIKYLGDELTKVKQSIEEKNNKISTSTQTEETASSTESTSATNSPTGEVKTEQLSEENKIKGLLIASINYIKNNMIQTVDKITKELKAINEATNISLLKIGTVSTGFLFDACNELVKEADEAIKKRDYRTAVSKILQLNEFTTSLAAEYYSAKQINETLKLATGEIKTKLIEKANSIYDKVKNDYKISSHSEYEVEPPIQLLANAYSNTLAQLLEEEVQKLTKKNKENEQTITNLNQQIETKDNDLATKNNEITDLKTQLDEKNRKISELENNLASIQNKLTASEDKNNSEQNASTQNPSSSEKSDTSNEENISNNTSPSEESSPSQNPSSSNDENVSNNTSPEENSSIDKNPVTNEEQKPTTNNNSVVKENDKNKIALIATSTTTGVLFFVVVGLVIYILAKKK